MKKSHLNEYGKVVHTTVSALFFNKQDQIMLIQKADKKYNKKWSVIAGHIEEGESVQTALLREVNEETGFLLSDDSYFKLAEFKNLNDTCRYGANFHDWYVFKVEMIKELKDFKFDAEEIIQAKFIDKSELMSMKENLTSGAKSLFLKLGFIS